jgi:hypothetical protein
VLREHAHMVVWLFVQASQQSAGSRPSPPAVVCSCNFVALVGHLLEVLLHWAPVAW